MNIYAVTGSQNVICYGHNVWLVLVLLMYLYYWAPELFIVLCCIFADDNSSQKRFVTGSHDETLLTWTWNRQKNQVLCPAVCRGHARSVDCITVSPDGSQVC